MLVSQMTANPLAPDVTKDSKEFGLKVLRQCYTRWRTGYGGESFAERMSRYDLNRLYVMGKQPQEIYEDFVKVEGRIPVVNLDKTPLSIAAPLLNAKADRYLERIEKIRCKAVGPISSKKKKEDKDKARFKMNYKEAIQAAQKQAGLQLEEFSDTDPKSDRELELQFKTIKAQKEEVILQRAINFVFDQNNWNEIIKSRMIWDVFCCGFAVTYTERDGNDFVKTPFVTPERFITSYSEFDDFNDWQYQGQRRSMSIAEVRLRYPGKVSEQELFAMSRKFTGMYGNPESFYCDWSEDYLTAIARPYDVINVEVVDLFYKTLYNLNYRKVNNAFRETLYDIVPGEKVKPENIEKSKPYYVAYHGVWIIDTDYVLEWGLAKNMLKDNGSLAEIRSPYCIHMYNNNKCRNTPLAEVMRPLIDQLQNIWLQSQKIIAMTAPDGFDIDMLGLSDIDLGKGIGVVSPMQLLDIYLQTGNRYFKGRDLEIDGGKQAPPIQPNSHPYSTKLEQLEAQFWGTYKKLQICTGDNNLASGNISNQATANSTLNDAREIAAEPSNYVYKTILNVHKGTAKNVELLTLDKILLPEKAPAGYDLGISDDDVEYMRSMTDNITELMFVTDVSVALNAADDEKWNKRIEIALEQQQITVGDVAELELIEDPIWRSFLLAQKEKENKADAAQAKQQDMQANLAQAKAAAETKSQGDMQLEALAHQNKMDQMQKDQESKVLDKSLTWSGVLKEKVADAILSKPDAKISDIPAFIWEGLGVTEEAQKAFVLNAMNDLAKSNQPPQQPPQQGQQQAAA